MEEKIRQKLRSEFNLIKLPDLLNKRSVENIVILSAEETGIDGENGSRIKTAIILYKKLSTKPKLVFLGTKSHNKIFNDFIQKQKLQTIIPSNRKEASTKTQIKDLAKFLKDKKGILIVSHLYHIPRIKRYVEKYFGKSSKNVDYYPVGNQKDQKEQIEKEIEKIIKYSATGDLPLYL